MEDTLKTEWPVESLRLMRDMMAAAVDAHNPNKPRPDVLQAITSGDLERKVQILNDLDRVVKDNS